MTIEIISTPVTPAWADDILGGINAAACALNAPPYEEELFGLQAVQDGRAVGHLTSKIIWEWLYVDLLWVEPAFQKHGIGTKLMRRAEAFACERKLVGAYCWTQSWQAPKFYKKLGYEEFVQFSNFPRGHQRIGFRKYLSFPRT